ncbi:MAG: hypothetical protein AAFU67_04030 [Bacteroidota bacterium]
MANGIDFTAAQAYKDFVEEFKDDLFAQIFYGFKTGELATPHQGVKGRLVLTELEVSRDLARRWNAPFEGFTNTSYTPTMLNVVTNKVEHSVIPQEFEGSYLGMMRRKGQSPTDYPFQAFILGKIIQKLRSELEFAAWSGVEAGTPANSDLLRQTFDGYLQQITDLITATTITPVGTGALTQANILASLRTMWDSVDSAYKENGTDIFMSYTTYDLYRRAYKDTYNVDPAYIKMEGSSYQGIAFELTNENTMIHPMPGMGSSSRIVMTPKTNLHYGYDDPSDWGNFRFQEWIRELRFWMDFNFGVCITQARDGILVVNDQA